MRTILYLLFFILPIHSIAQKHIVTFPYGRTGSLSFDLHTGLYQLHQARLPILGDVKASAVVNGRTISSTDQYRISYRTEAVADRFGRGKKHIFHFVRQGLPEMQLNFYAYPHLSYLLTELHIRGNGLESNSVTPVEGSFGKIAGEARTLFLPFDNDTFISYDARPFRSGTTNTSAEAGAVYDDQSRRGIIAGSVLHDQWKTGVTTACSDTKGNTICIRAGYTAENVTRDKLKHGLIKGDIISSPLIFVGAFDDWRDGLEAFGRADRIADPPYLQKWTKPTPVGWNSWGAMQSKLSYDKVTGVADFFADSLRSFRNGGTAYIDLDSFWDHLLQGGPNGDWSKLKAFAAHCRSRGLEPGVYWAPFADWGWKDGADRKVEGSNYKYGEIWTKIGPGYEDLDGARALDPTHPGTQEKIAYMIGKFKDCGFSMIKIDFLGHAAFESDHFYDPKVTTGMQAYRQGMEYLTDQLDGKMLVYAAISPSLATGRYAHMRRIACDAFQTIKDTKYTLNSVNYGWWQSELYPYIDADHVVLGNRSAGENRARILSALITGSWITGDDFSEPGPWRDRAKKWFQDPDLLEMTRNGKAFRPVYGNTGTGTGDMFIGRVDGRTYLAVFNFTETEKSYVIDSKRIGLPERALHPATELFSKKPIWISNGKKLLLPAADAAVFRLDP